MFNESLRYRLVIGTVVDFQNKRIVGIAREACIPVKTVTGAELERCNDGALLNALFTGAKILGLSSGFILR